MSKYQPHLLIGTMIRKKWSFRMSNLILSDESLTKRNGFEICSFRNCRELPKPCFLDKIVHLTSEVSSWLKSKLYPRYSDKGTFPSVTVIHFALFPSLSICYRSHSQSVEKTSQRLHCPVWMEPIWYSGVHSKSIQPPPHASPLSITYNHRQLQYFPSAFTFTINQHSQRYRNFFFFWTLYMVAK